jgi:hypothetical protein
MSAQELCRVLGERLQSAEHVGTKCMARDGWCARWRRGEIVLDRDLFPDLAARDGDLSVRLDEDVVTIIGKFLVCCLETSLFLPSNFGNLFSPFLDHVFHFTRCGGFDCHDMQTLNVRDALVPFWRECASCPVRRLRFAWLVQRLQKAGILMSQECPETWASWAPPYLYRAAPLELVSTHHTLTGWAMPLGDVGWVKHYGIPPTEAARVLWRGGVGGSVGTVGRRLVALAESMRRLGYISDVCRDEFDSGFVRFGRGKTKVRLEVAEDPGRVPCFTPQLFRRVRWGCFARTYRGLPVGRGFPSPNLREHA